MVAGVIGAVTNNALGIAGTTWHVRMLALKFARETSGPAADAAEAIRYAVQEKAHVINASFSVEADDSFLRAAIEFANTAGVLVVAAAAKLSETNGSKAWCPPLANHWLSGKGCSLIEKP